MKHGLIALSILCFLAVPSAAQEQEPPSLIERGAQQFLENLLQEMEPAWGQMQNFMDEMGPAMLELMESIKDWSAYDPPEVLENGDIILRRKQPQVSPPVEPPSVTEL
ncbi:MAG: hypothetical protein ABJ360_05720 [Roseobacter sp.]